MRMARGALTAAVLIAVAAFGAQGSFAAQMGMGEELKTAIAHAKLAQQGGTMQQVGVHLRHVLNCLVGPGDKMFNQAAGNPCAGQGKGILPDIKGMMGVDPEYHVAWWLAHLAQEAVTMGNADQAKAAAHIIEVQLTAMSKM